MGRIKDRDLRFFAIEEGVVEVPHPDKPGRTRKWKVYNLVLYVDKYRVVVSLPVLPRDDETRRAYESIELEILTAFSRQRCIKPVQNQAAFGSVLGAVRQRVRQELPHAAVNAYDYKVRALSNLFPLSIEHDKF